MNYGEISLTWLFLPVRVTLRWYQGTTVARVWTSRFMKVHAHASSMFHNHDVALLCPGLLRLYHRPNGWHERYLNSSIYYVQTMLTVFLQTIQTMLTVFFKIEKTMFWLQTTTGHSDSNSVCIISHIQRYTKETTLGTKSCAAAQPSPVAAGLLARFVATAVALPPGRPSHTFLAEHINVLSQNRHHFCMASE